MGCRHTLADGNQRIQIRDKTLMNGVMVLRTPSPYPNLQVIMQIR